MDHPRCIGCGVARPVGANFCAACGAHFEPEHLEVRTVAQFGGASAPSQQRVRWLAVAMVAAVAIVGLWVLSGWGSSDSTSGSATTSRNLPPSSLVENTATAPQNSDVFQLNPPVLPGTLPATEGTHLAVASGAMVHILDFRTGQWETAETDRRLALWGGGLDGRIDSFADGVLVQTAPNTRLVHVTTTGEVTVIHEVLGTRFLGVHEDSAFVSAVDAVSGQEVISAINADGETKSRTTLPEQARSVGVTLSGLVVYQAGSGIHVASPETSTFVANGTAIGVLAEAVLFQECDRQPECAFYLVDVAGGAPRILDLPAGTVTVQPDGDVVVIGVSGQLRRFQSIDGDLVEVGLVEGRPVGAQAAALDSGGVWARVLIGQIEFVGIDGSVAAIPFDVTPCCQAFAITFISSTG